MGKPVVGDVQDSPQEITPVSAYLTNEKNRLNGYRIWFRVRVEGWRPVTAWREVFPDSTAADESARTQCSRFLKWYEETYPPTFHQAANKFRLHPYRLMAKFNELIDAKRWAWSEEAGTLVETAAPNHAVQLNVIRELLKLVARSELWRKQFLEQESTQPALEDLPPKFRTVPEYEEWMQRQDLLGDIARSRREATEARDRRLAEEGRLPLPKAPTDSTE